jgi:hypothetical protein
MLSVIFRLKLHYPTLKFQQLSPTENLDLAVENFPKETLFTCYMIFPNDNIIFCRVRKKVNSFHVQLGDQYLLKNWLLQKIYET